MALLLGPGPHPQETAVTPPHAGRLRADVGCRIERIEPAREVEQNLPLRPVTNQALNPEDDDRPLAPGHRLDAVDRVARVEDAVAGVAFPASLETITVDDQIAAVVVVCVHEADSYGDVRPELRLPDEGYVQMVAILHPWCVAA